MQTSRYNKLLICHQPNFGTGWQDLKGWCPKQLLKVLISIRFWPAKYAILWALQLAKDLEITPRKWWGSAWQCQREVTLLTITALTTMIKTPHIYIWYIPLRATVSLPRCHCHVFIFVLTLTITWSQRKANSFLTGPAWLLPKTAASRALCTSAQHEPMRRDRKSVV